MDAARTKGRDARETSLEEIHRELFGGFDRGDRVSSSNGRSFEIFSVFQPKRMTYSANSKEG